MSIEAWAIVGGLGVAAITAIPGILGAIWTRRGNAATAVAAEAAQAAASNSEPVGNGFTASVNRQLGEILAMSTEARDEATKAREVAEQAKALIVDHLAAHANGAAPVIPLRPAREARS